MRLDNEQPVPTLQLPALEELLAFFNGLAVRKEVIAADTGFGTETIFYVER